MVNGVAEDLAERPFEIFLRNFVMLELRMPNGMVIAHSIKSPLTLLNIGEGLGREFSLLLNIPAPASLLIGAIKMQKTKHK